MPGRIGARRSGQGGQFRYNIQMTTEIEYTPETLVLDLYPWAVPTEEQKCMFDALPAEEKRVLIRAAVQEGIDSGDSGTSVADLLDRLDRDRLA